MGVDFRCPNCGERYTVGDIAGGKKRCGYCCHDFDKDRLREYKEMQGLVRKKRSHSVFDSYGGGLF